MRRFLRLPNRLPVRLPERRVRQKWLAAAAIGALATLLAVGWRHTIFISEPMERLDYLLYDVVYRSRALEDRTNGPVVIVTIDQDSLDALENGLLFEKPIGWVWPRELYIDVIKYLQRSGARVVAFDMIQEHRDTSNHGSDGNLAEYLQAEAKIPVVFGHVANEDGTRGKFAIPVENPILGAVNAPGEVLRTFKPFVNGHPSLAFQAATLYAGRQPGRREAFFARFYGPHQPSPGRTTYRYVSAASVLAAAFAGEAADDPAQAAELVKAAEAKAGLDPDLFRDRIVLFGATAPSLFDYKAAPVSDLYPGVEWQATAVDNLLAGHEVVPVPLWMRISITAVASSLAALGALLPRRTSAKLAAAVLAAAAVTFLAVALFRGETIRWLPMASPLTALVLSTIGAMSWSYFTEGRQRQFISKAFALSTSPVIAEAIDRNPEKLKLGGERREITVMFTDLAGFTDLSETMEVVKLAQVINTYMEAMSEEIVKRDGYLDKYIGDAIMSFWNGLVDQPDHAARACRAALAIKRRELEIAPDLQKLVDARIVTRIGINTGPMAVGNLGSSRKLSYTVLGDAVNLGARLEPANKLYGTEVLISQTVAEQVNGQFVMRELDLLRVKGKQKPMGVFELMAEGDHTSELRARVELYTEGLAHYRAQRWEKAEGALLRLLRECPDDAPAAVLLRRVAKLRHEELAPDWDGVYVAKEK
jgi:adenylate cyclase